MSAVPGLDRQGCGEDAFLGKPFDLGTLTDTLQRLLARAG
jgi:hypothetical protein